METPDFTNELNWLREENARLKEILRAHGIPFEVPYRKNVKAQDSSDSPKIRLTLEEKVNLFQR